MGNVGNEFFAREISLSRCLQSRGKVHIGDQIPTLRRAGDLGRWGAHRPSAIERERQQLCQDS